MARPHVADGETASRSGKQLRMYTISSIGQPIRGGPPTWGLGEVLKTHHHKNLHHVTNQSQKPQNQTDPSVNMEWIYLAEVRDRWRALVNAVMNLRVS